MLMADVNMAVCSKIAVHKQNSPVFAAKHLKIDMPALRATKQTGEMSLTTEGTSMAKSTEVLAQGLP